MHSSQMEACDQKPLIPTATTAPTTLTATTPRPAVVVLLRLHSTRRQVLAEVLARAVLEGAAERSRLLHRSSQENSTQAHTLSPTMSSGVSTASSTTIASALGAGAHSRNSRSAEVPSLEVQRFPRQQTTEILDAERQVLMQWLQRNATMGRRRTRTSSDNG